MTTRVMMQTALSGNAAGTEYNYQYGQAVDMEAGLAAKLIADGRAIAWDDGLSVVAAQVNTVLPAGWEDLRVALSRATAGSATPTFGAYLTSFQAWSFSASATNELFCEVQIPHNWAGVGNALAAEIRPHIHWTPGSTDTGTIVWQLSHSWANVNGVFPAATVMTKVTQAGAGVANTHQLLSLGAIDGTGKLASSVLLLKVARLGADGADTFTGVAYGISLDIHLQVRGFGGLTELAGAV